MNVWYVKNAYAENRANNTFPETPETWETCADYAQPPIMLFLIDLLSKNIIFVSERDLTLSKNINFI